MLRAFLALIRDPSQTDRVFEISENGRAARGPLVVETVDRLTSDPAFMELYRSGYAPKVPSLEELAKFPEGSFGRAYARHMLDNGLAADFFPAPTGGGPERYLLERGRGSHDYWHVLTGYDTSVPGEIGLQAFSLAQLRSPFSAILIAGGLLHAITHAPQIFGAMIDQLFEGYTMGQRARTLISLPLESWLSRPLAELRIELGIVPHGA